MKNLTKILFIAPTAFLASALLVTMLLSANSNAQSIQDPFLKAFKEGRPYIDARYRYEYVEDDAFSNEANASTFRTRVGFESGEFLNGMKGTIEFENISVFPADSEYNNTINGKTTYPTVADPDGNEINKLHLDFLYLKRNVFRVGRQELEFDNERFVGDYSWRQNNQTFDAITIDNEYIKDLNFKYSYVYNVNTVFGNDSPVGDYDSNSHLVSVNFSRFKQAIFGVYGYFIDLDRNTLSNNTYGLYLEGDARIQGALRGHYHFEYAMQEEYADNPNSYETDYFNLSAGIKAFGWGANIGYEVLGSEGTAGTAFRTPLASGHKFNGWSDKFLNPLAGGLEDLNFTVSYNTQTNNEILKDIGVLFRYHDFQAAEGSTDYGSEIDFQLTKEINENYSVAMKYADFTAETASGLSDSTKFWFLFNVRY